MPHALYAQLPNIAKAVASVIHSLSRFSTNKMERTVFFRHLARQFRKHFSYDRLCINLYDAEREVLTLFTAADGTVVESITNNRITRNTVASLVIASRKPIVITDLSAHNFESKPHPLASVGLNATIAVPLILKKEVIGSLHLSFATQPEDTVEILNFLVELCPTLTLFIFAVLADEKLESLRTGKTQLDKPFDVPFETRLVNTQDMARTMSTVHKMSPLDIPLLITGETGTGKSMLARYIHQCSPRRAANFVKVNCPSLVSTLFESEMFGHTKGAFTGANAKRMGRVEMAHKGTLFLDEIAELSPDMQCKLLQIFEEKSFERVGESHQQYVDLRLISATNVHISEALAAKRLRQDLYYRLASVVIAMPALRERKNDIVPLLLHFLTKFEGQYAAPHTLVPAESMEVLHSYAWPGNIRELRNVANHLVLHSMDRALTPQAVRDILQESPASAPALAPVVPSQPFAAHSSTPSTPSPSPASDLMTLRENERAYIESVIARAHGKLSGPQGAAALLGMPRSTLQHRMRKLGIRVTSG